MQLVQDQSSIVVLGVWNPAILNPSWLARMVHEIPGGEGVQVQAEQFLFVPGQAPRFTLSGVRYSPNRNRLIIQPTETSEDNYRRVQRSVVRILDLLPHTPVAGIGQNYIFVEGHPTAEQLEIFSAGNDIAARCNFEFENVGTQLVSTLRVGGRILNLTRSIEGGTLTINFNFHYEAATAAGARESMANEGLFWENLIFAQRTIQELYEIEVTLAPAAEAAAQPAAANI